jgi:hypothetical protein
LNKCSKKAESLKPKASKGHLYNKIMSGESLKPKAECKKQIGESRKLKAESKKLKTRIGIAFGF